MQADFGLPPTAQECREIVEQRLKEVREANGLQETATVEWRGKAVHVEVIDMPVDLLAYNPGTHRIRAQRSHDPVGDYALERDPWSEQSQDYLQYLLTALPADPSRRDPAFDELRESLREFKQNEPGLITRDGILVNGNTRRAALKELGWPDIRVGVLPASCTWKDIHHVELSLQLRPDQRREYSYINHLLALDEQLSRNRPVAAVAKDFRTTVPACERDVWILAQLRELIARSGADGLQLRLLDFESHKEKLFELHRAYKKAFVKSKESADLLKESRLAAIVLGYAKTDVRFIEPDFRTRYLDRVLPESLKTPAAAPATVAIPGLGRSIKSAGADLAGARAFTDMLVQAKAVQVAPDKAAPAQLADASARVLAAREAFDEAIESAGKDSRIRKKRQAAPDRIADACKDLELCITDLVLARGSGSLDEEAFDEAVLRFRDTLAKVALESKRSIEIPGEGVSWLLYAVSGEGK